MTARTVHVNVPGGGYDVVIEPGGLKRLGPVVSRAAPARSAVLAADARILDGHGAVAAGSLRRAGYAVTVVPLEAAEEHKTLSAARRIYEAMAGAEPRPDRATPVVALGGGIVGDLAGFAAATFMRGLPLVAVPTTLLAMVDAAVGGKTGVNLELPGGRLAKNMVGAFWQPRAVLADPDVLRTLAPRDLRCGLAECVKYALIADAGLLTALADGAAAFTAPDRAAIAPLIERCVRIKASVVEADEREAGPRAVLNLGHTFAHAVEAHPQLGLRHGEAVAVGLAAAAFCSLRTGRLRAEQRDRILAVIDALGLPARLEPAAGVDALLQSMRHDKKARSGRLRLVLPVGLGSVEITDEVDDDLLRAAWAEVGATPEPAAGGRP